MKIDFSLLPPNVTQHFHPTEQFLQWWKDYCGDNLVFELGAGRCAFAKAATDLGVKTIAIEPRVSDDVLMAFHNFVLPLPFERANFLSEKPSIVVVARPDHSGWVQTIPDYIHPESQLIYIGLSQNFNLDFDWNFKVLYNNAGHDGEKVILKVDN